MESPTPTLDEFQDTVRSELAYLSDFGFEEVQPPSHRGKNKFEIWFQCDDRFIIVRGEGWGTIAYITLEHASGLELYANQWVPEDESPKPKKRNTQENTQLQQVGEAAQQLREFGQDYRHHNHRDSEHFAIRTVFRLAEELMPGLTYAPMLAIAWRRALILLPKHLTWALVFTLLFTVLWPLTVSAQDTDDDVVRVNTDLLLFPIRIKDKKGQTVPDFSEKDLTLKDPDGVTSGLYFSAGVDRVAMVFALDQSGSLREIVAQQRTAAIALFSRFSDRSSVAVLRFAETPELAAPFNTDPSAAHAAFQLPAARDRHPPHHESLRASVADQESWRVGYRSH
jgi:hypothetical protein